MKYALLIHEPAAEFERRQGPDAAEYWAGWKAYTEAIAAAGVMAGGAGLEPPTTATTVRVVDGERQVQDGPFAETKELLGGFYLIEVPSLDEALAWAGRCPTLPSGSVEVRPVMSSDGE